QTDVNSIKLKSLDTQREYQVQPGDRLSGIIYDRLVFQNAKGKAVEGIELPQYSGEYEFLEQFLPESYSDFFQEITLENWLANPLAVDLLPNYTYQLTGVSLPQVLNPSAVIPFKDIQAGTVLDSIRFTVAESNEVYGEWVDFLTLRFTYGKLETVKIPQAFRWEDWRGVVGSRGSLLGVTVGNSIIGLQNKVPAVACDGIVVTRATSVEEKTRAEIVEDLLGARSLLTRVQHQNITSDLSVSDDYWFQPATKKETIIKENTQYLRYHDDILTIEHLSGEFKVNAQTTYLNFPNSLLGINQNGYLLLWDQTTNKLYKGRDRYYLSSYSEVDSEVFGFNCSHGYYLHSNVGSNFPTLLKRDGLIIKKLLNANSNYYLLKEYPMLVHRGVSTFVYQDLLTGTYFESNIFVDKISADGKIGYSKDTAEYLLFEGNEELIGRSLGIRLIKLILTKSSQSLPFQGRETMTKPDFYEVLTDQGKAILDKESKSKVINENSQNFLFFSEDQLIV
ncbi:MAG: hypothetical protein ACRC80_35905, partial [Waterburya sp.]